MSEEHPPPLPPRRSFDVLDRRQSKITRGSVQCRRRLAIVSFLVLVPWVLLYLFAPKYFLLVTPPLPPSAQQDIEEFLLEQGYANDEQKQQTRRYHDEAEGQPQQMLDRGKPTAGHEQLPNISLKNVHNKIANDAKALSGKNDTSSLLAAPYEKQTNNSTNGLQSPINETYICQQASINFTAASRLAVIVTGCENSGTTIMGQLLMSVPGLFGAFECGMLLSNSKPAHFSIVQPFFEWMTSPLNWKLTSSQRTDLLKSSCWASMYRRLHLYSPLFQQYPYNESYIVDKTPGYIYKLQRIMQKAPGVPVIITQKSLTSQVNSWMKRKENATDEHRHFFEERYKRAQLALKQAQRAPNLKDRILVVDTAQLYRNTTAVMQRVFDFLHLEWKPDYLTMQALNAKHASVGLPANIKPFDPTVQQKENETSGNIFEEELNNDDIRKLVLAYKRFEKQQTRNQVFVKAGG